jgi:membrane protease YdiL (CAAX protease family)
MQSQNPTLRALSDILVLVGLALIGGVVFSFLGLFPASWFSGIAREEIPYVLSQFETIEGSRMAILVLQGIMSLGSFFALPSLIIWIKKDTIPDIQKTTISTQMWVLVVALAFLMMPVNGWLAQWNENIRLPEILNGFQEWARSKEDEMKNLTLFLVRFQNTGEWIAGILVISLIAGFAEEFFFRRLLQPRMVALFNNAHSGIWATSFFFSAIHFQFYGFIPRMVLGALFGYYFQWTGRIILPIIGHSLNNFVTLLGMVLYVRNMSPINIEDPTNIPWFIGAVAAGIAWSLALMFMEESEKLKNQTPNWDPKAQDYLA